MKLFPGPKPKQHKTIQKEKKKKKKKRKKEEEEEDVKRFSTWAVWK